MTKELDRAAENHTSFKVTARKPAKGKIVFRKSDNEMGFMEMNVVNSPIGYSPNQLQGFYDMIRVLQEEGTLGESGSIEIGQLEVM